MTTASKPRNMFIIFQHSTARMPSKHLYIHSVHNLFAEVCMNMMGLHFVSQIISHMLGSRVHSSATVRKSTEKTIAH
jgi:hypothetical protein